MPFEQKGVYQPGCSIYSLTGFPWDNVDAWAASQRDAMVKWIAAHKDSKRAYILSINSNQLNAKKALEAAGFKVIAVCHTAHIDWNANAIAAWKADFAKGKLNEDTIYLMGRGFWAVKKRKKGA